MSQPLRAHRAWLRLTESNSSSWSQLSWSGGFLGPRRQGWVLRLGGFLAFPRSLLVLARGPGAGELAVLVFACQEVVTLVRVNVDFERFLLEAGRGQFG